MGGRSTGHLLLILQTNYSLFTSEAAVYYKLHVFYTQSFYNFLSRNAGELKRKCTFLSDDFISDS